MKNELENEVSENFVLTINNFPRTCYFTVLFINWVQSISIINRITSSCLLPDDARYGENVWTLKFCNWLCFFDNL